MNLPTQRLLPIIALCALLAAPLASAMGPAGQGHGDPERMLGRLSEHLGLSEQQQDEVERILAQDSQQLRADRERMQAIRNALDAQHSDFDAGETQKLADELGEITSRMAYGFTSKQAQVYTVLTDAQREEFARLHEERESRAHRRFGKHRD